MLYLIQAFTWYGNQYYYSILDSKAMFHNDVLQTVNHNFHAPKNTSAVLSASSDPAL